MPQAAVRRTIDRLRTLAGIAALAGAGTLAACGSDASGPSAPAGPKIYANPVGTYALGTVNDKSVPVSIFSGDNFTYEVTAGSLTLTADGKFSVKQTYRQTIAGKVDTFVDSTGGTWAISGTQVSFINGQDASTDKATWSNTGSLTFVEQEGTATNNYVYLIKP